MRRRDLMIGGFLAIPFAGFTYWLNASKQKPLPPTLTDAEYFAIQSAVNPAKGEDLFAEIPWQISLWDARRLAAKEGKPILLWEMDGHPLGCG